MPLADIIAEKLRLEFAPQRLAVHDDSARHAGHAGARPGGESHFRVEIVATAFALQRHCSFIDGQAVKSGTIQAGKGL